jgi:alcohol dehydrogenase (cytochrome c)
MELRMNQTKPLFACAILTFNAAWVTALAPLPTQLNEQNSQNPPLPSSGAALYAGQCLGCHGDHLQGNLGPPLKGPSFDNKWLGRATALRNFIVSNMPPSAAGTLSKGSADALAAMLLSKATDIEPAIQSPSDRKALSDSAASTSPASSHPNEDEVYVAEMARRLAVLQGITPVSDDMLQRPVESDWLNSRRTYDANAFSPLREINKANVNKLHQIWSLSLPHGANEISPLVHDGVMFVDSNGVITAIEGATGTVLWRHERRVNAPSFGRTQPRNMAIRGTTVFVATLDAHMLALDAKTGNALWDHAIGVDGGPLRLTTGPIIVRDKILQGVSGCAGTEFRGGCFIVALDVSTGREVWRFDTLQHLGSKGVDTWNGAPDDQRFGGSVWGLGTYDPDINLVYFGTGQTYHIAPLMGSAHKKTNTDALYTDSTLALDPDTGRLKWFYQHMAHDVWDLDWAFERTITNLTIDGVNRRVLITIGKVGIIDVLDARTGQYIYSHDLGYQNVIDRIDHKTGAKHFASNAKPILNVPILLCPHSQGVRSWPATAYDSEQHLLFATVLKSCMHFLWHDKSDWDISYALEPPQTNDGLLSETLAFDVIDRKIRWSTKSRAPRMTAMLATAGGLLFDGGSDRIFRALDSGTGDVLWQTRLSDTPSSFPISFAIDGHQYVALVAGGGSPLASFAPALTPELQEPSYATVLSVFALEK